MKPTAPLSAEAIGLLKWMIEARWRGASFERLSHGTGIAQDQIEAAARELDLHKCARVDGATVIMSPEFAALIKQPQSRERYGR